jgi:hypothetical protein
LPETAAAARLGPCSDLSAAAPDPQPRRLDEYRSVNALAEAFFATMKRELRVHDCTGTSETDARRDVFRWIAFYNHRRRHSALGHCVCGFDRRLFSCRRPDFRDTAPLLSSFGKLFGPQCRVRREVESMGRYLVVANQTLGGNQLIQAARQRMLREPSAFWVLVPATRPSHLAESAYASGYLLGPAPDSYGSATGPESGPGTDSGASLAQQRLDAELYRLREAGAEADGEVGDPDPFRAISNTLKYKQFDEIILSTLPHGRSRWLRQDLPGKVKKKFGIPVTHLVAG